MLLLLARHLRHPQLVNGIQFCGPYTDIAFVEADLGKQLRTTVLVVEFHLDLVVV